MAMNKKNAVFCGATPCGSCKIRRFGLTSQKEALLTDLLWVVTNLSRVNTLLILKMSSGTLHRVALIQIDVSDNVSSFPYADVKESAQLSRQMTVTNMAADRTIITTDGGRISIRNMGIHLQVHMTKRPEQ
jgi:hypothetical protein